MGIPPESPAPAVNRRWLWAVRILALASAVAVGGVYFSIPFFLFPIVAALVYLAIVWNLRGRLVKRGLAMAGISGVVVLLFAVWTPGIVKWLKGPCGLGRSEQGATLIMVAQVALVFAALATYLRLGWESGDWRSLGHGTLVGLTLFAVGMVSLTPEYDAGYGGRGGPGVSEAQAVGMLRTLNSSQRVFSDSYRERGYAASLGELAEAGLIPVERATGEYQRYRFVLLPGSKDTGGRVLNYEIHARPLQAGGRGGGLRWRSFFTDESAVVRWTCEDRAATAQDPPL